MEVPIILMERRASQFKLSTGIVRKLLLMPLKLRWHTRAIKREMGTAKLKQAKKPLEA